MSMYLIAPSIAIVANLLLAIFVLYKNPQNKLNRLFALFSLFFVAWAVMDVVFLGSSTAYNVILANKIGNLVVAISSALIVHFSLLFTENKISTSKKSIIIYLPILLLAYLDFFTEKIYSGTVEVFWGLNIVPGPLFIVPMIYIIGCYVLGLGVFYGYRQTAKAKIKKKQVQLLMLALIIPLVSGAVSQVVFPLLGLKMLPFGSSMTIFTTIIIAYTIVKYNAMASIGLKTIKAKIIIPVMVVATIILSITTTYSYFFNIKTIKSEISSRFESIMELRVDYIERILERDKKYIAALGSDVKSSNLLLIDKTSDTYIERYNEVKAKIMNTEYEWWSEIFVLDAKGVVIISTNESQVGVDKSQNEHYKNRKNGIYQESVGFLNADYQDFYTISTAIKNSKGELDGLILVKVEMTAIEDVVSSTIGLGETGESYIVNKNNSLISSSRFESKIKFKQKINTVNTKNCFDYAKQQEIKKHNKLQVFDDYRGVSVVGAYSHIPEIDWCLLVEMDEAEVMAVVLKQLLFSTVRIIIVLFLIFITIYFSSRNITSPIIELYKKIKEIEKGNLNIELKTNQQDEIGELSRAFAKMVNTIKEARKDIEKKVYQQTKEIQKNTESLIAKQDDMENQQLAIMNILEDVEDEKEKTKLLADDLEKFQMAVENASDHIVITDPDGICIYANKAVETITGYSKKEIIQKKIGTKDNWGGQMEKSIYEKMWDTIKVKKKSFKGDFDNIRKGGEKYVARSSISPVLNSDGEVIFLLGIERDITKEKEIDKAKTEFVSLASHQLRTPLSTINWYAEMLMDGDVGKITKDQNNCVKEIYAGSQRMVALVNSLLNVSRLELGTFTIEPEKASITKIADGAINEIRHKIVAKKQKLSKKYDKGIPKMMLDKKLMHIIFQNLLSNAIKYTPKKGELDLKILKKGRKILIEMTDTGMGIPKKEQMHVFKKLFRANNVRKADVKGTGLGLYIIKQIVSHSGGKIRFKSRVNKGTVFSIELPIKGMQRKFICR